MELDKKTDESRLSAAFFCPQSRAPDEEYLAALHAFLAANPLGRLLLAKVADLETNQVWSIFASARPEIQALAQGPEYIRVLRDWALYGISGPLAAVRSGIVALPLLVILQIGQYLRYLDFHQLSHDDFLSAVGGAGGLQGYCGGLPSAIAIGCAHSVEQVVENAAICLRLLVGIGAYGEFADDTNGSGSTTLALRLKREGQGQELTLRFPGTYISAITDPRSISIVGPANQLDKLFHHAREEGLQVQKMDIRGKVHNPENTRLAAELCGLCRDNALLQLPEYTQLRVPVRSNKNGHILDCPLTDEIITTILASRCDWYTLLTRVSEDIQQSKRSVNEFVIFGLNDCVPMSPFRSTTYKAFKTEAHQLISNVNRQMSSPITQYQFPADAIAVVGASCRLPGAGSIEQLWDLLKNGMDLHSEIPSDRFDIYGSFRASQSSSFISQRKFYGNFLDDVRCFDNSYFGINAREAMNMDPQQRLLLELSVEALDDAGYLATHKRQDGDDVGCFIGASLVEYLDNTNAHTPTAYTATGTIRAFLCGRLSHFYGWTGPAEVLDTACSSSLVAINRACKAIQAGECRMALAGGVNVIAGMNNYFDLGKAGFLSPTGQCKPFDASADGYCRSEGGGLVVLKPLKQAVADGDAILGVIAGAATNQGGLSTSITVPESAAQKKLYSKVLKQAGIEPRQVTYVEAHGTGTQAGDPLEMDSIRAVFGNRSRDEILHVGSIKGNIGHCETAAGVMGLMKILAMIKFGAIPQQANHYSLNPKIAPLASDGLAIPKKTQPWNSQLKAALVNSYGAAGSNCALLCCDPPVREESDAGLPRNTAFPICISASSEGSLADNIRAVSAHLGRNGDNIDLRDLAYTLNGRRRKHEYAVSIMAKGIGDAKKQLDSLGASDFFKTSPSRKPIILTFSGQHSKRVSLDKSMYDGFPVFRHHLDSCDQELRNLGFPSILPSLIHSDPSTSVTTLQCSQFAVQYACARTWIDAGLKPNVVIGHSLGELTALAVSGVLSLPDAIKLVATRGSLIETKWGAEKGSMLALNCTLKELDLITSTLHNRGPSDLMQPNFEVACHNATNSQVIVGTEDAIAAVEGLLGVEPDLRKIRSQRLDTTHGFHSVLAEPILEELADICGTLQWNEPTIPLESCMEQKIWSIKQYSVSAHARQPVYFFEAVRRLEDSLGSCIWLEAGIDTPITAMIKNACRDPALHVFQSLRTKGKTHPSDCIGDAICALWKEGISLTQWGFMSHEHRLAKPIWLPPYQFEKIRHWLPNIDRAAEMKQKLSRELTAEACQQQPVSPPQLVSIKTEFDEHTRCAEFAINTESRRFVEIVSGHKVRSRPLCPASMYMECVVMALQHLRGDLGTSSSSLVFEKLHFHAALGVKPQGEVLLQVKQSPDQDSWEFTLRTTVPGASRSRETLHGSGIISVTGKSLLDPFHRLVSHFSQQIESRVEVTRMTSKKAYKLFSRVVDYAVFFQGIQSVILDESEAAGTISIPSVQPSRQESTAWRVLDAVTLDAFIQVIGLLMNSSDFVSEDEVMVMVGLDYGVISSACKMDEATQWKVYAKFDNTQQPVGDVFVTAPDGGVVAMLGGCRFNTILISKLEKALDSANGGLERRIGSEWMLRAEEDVVSNAPSEMIATPSSEHNERTALDSCSRLRDMVSEYTGVSYAEILEDAVLSDLGLDSLAAVEMVGELSSKFGLIIDSTELVNCTLKHLYQRLGASKPTIQGTRPRQHSQVTPLNPNGRIQSPADLHNGNADYSDKGSKFLNILADISCVRATDIQPGVVLADLGVDSLSVVDLKHELEEQFSVKLDAQLTDLTVAELMSMISIQQPGRGTADAIPPKQASPASIIPDRTRDLGGPNPFHTLAASDSFFDTSATCKGFLGYWSEVAPFQDKLLIAYIVEAFAALGVDLRQLGSGEVVPQVSHQVQKYNKLISRLWGILCSHDLVAIDERTDDVIRTDGIIGGESAESLQADFEARFPDYQPEANLIGLTGPKLADCLSGKVDAVAVMFGTLESLKIMEGFYSQSPMMATLTEQLCIYLELMLESHKDRPARILEVGAGTGGTTGRLIEVLRSSGIAVEYTFTDISSSLVAKAKNKFKQYPWMQYATFNLEKEVPSELRAKFDIVVSANCVHATTNRTASCRRLGELLAPGGFIVLSEVTCLIDWYDICFGLLDGWWLAENRTAYPLQPAEAWMKTFQEAGYASFSYSRGTTPESNSQQLLVACNQKWDVPKTSKPEQRAESAFGADYKLETMIYKEVSGIPIQADVYFPVVNPGQAMPIALMIHGGGHMTLSRKAIRPAQTEHLLKNGFLPVSIDYRLCPEVTLECGPIADTCDAYRWARLELPGLAAGRGVEVDGTKIVVIGWSSGGHLAMTLGWTAEVAGMPAPSAVLSFYAPIDFESGELDKARLPQVPGRSMRLEQIMEALPRSPITGYTQSAMGDDSKLGWVRPGDPRSELVLALFKEGIGLPLLLHGLPEPGSRGDAVWRRLPSPAQIASISPLARLRDGEYRVPTYVIHGTADQIAPFEGAERFVRELSGSGIRHGFLPLEGVGHIHDVELKPGDALWDSQVGPGYQFLFDLITKR
ncbi:BcPKS16, polyketide synthase [Stachybotrys elegans]|uniref:BcPKS16, polyketide synthase n=1 Tax=Stachybotrys elegans TaxID=80388 RepID=A0A8K0STC0_9HYPO|nr:BcPKS16, polyketide synthase [Stachybotrys elegans]